MNKSRITIQNHAFYSFSIFFDMLSFAHMFFMNIFFLLTNLILNMQYIFFIVILVIKKWKFYASEKYSSYKAIQFFSMHLQIWHLKLKRLCVFSSWVENNKRYNEKIYFKDFYKKNFKYSL